MFAKPYRLKSQTALKNSEKKQLVARLRQQYPALAPSDGDLGGEAGALALALALGGRGACSCMRLELGAREGGTALVYCAEGAPRWLELPPAPALLPTLATLWTLPHLQLLPHITIHDALGPKIMGGSPLYVPGVVRGPAQGAEWARGEAVALCTESNGAALAVARASLSAAQLRLAASGACVQLVHVAGDQLCADARFSPLARPALPPRLTAPPPCPAPAPDTAPAPAAPARDHHWPALPSHPGTKDSNSNEASEPDSERGGGERGERAIVEEQLGGEGEAESEEVARRLGTCALAEAAGGVPGDMGARLRWSMLTWCTREARAHQLPVPASTLYRELGRVVREQQGGAELDVRRTPYKKFSVFLQEMHQEGVVEVVSAGGVVSVARVCREHAALRAHRTSLPAPAPSVLAAPAPAPAPPGQLRVLTSLQDVYFVTQPLTAILPYKKGAAVSLGEVRAAVRAWAERAGAARGAHVLVDGELAGAAGGGGGLRAGELAPWAAVHAALAARLTKGARLLYSDGTSLETRTPPQPIAFSTQTRAGNKKVTVVEGLEAWGVSVAGAARAWPALCGAACSALPPAAASGPAAAPRLLLHGDQRVWVARTLVHKYGLDRRYILGADKLLHAKSKPGTTTTTTTTSSGHKHKRS